MPFSGNADRLQHYEVRYPCNAIIKAKFVPAGEGGKQCSPDPANSFLMDSYNFITPETEKTMRDYLATNRSDRYGKFTYSTDILPVPVERLHDEFAAYRERFGIDIETRR